MGEVHRPHWGCPWVSGGIHRQGVPSGSLAGFLIESARLVTRVLVSLIRCKGPGAVLPAGH